MTKGEYEKKVMAMSFGLEAVVLKYKLPREEAFALFLETFKRGEEIL